MALKVEYKDMVSVAFHVRNKCIKLKQCLSLFDSGSPTCFVKQSLVPFIITSKTFASRYNGIGNNKLSTYGTIFCDIEYRGKIYGQYFYILPDTEAIVPLLIGRDLMEKMNIHLCQIENIKSYAKNEMLHLNKSNKENIISDKITDALKSYDLLKRPFQKKTEVPNQINSSDKPFDDNFKHELCIGAIDFENRENLKDIEQVILLIDTEETDEKFNINTELSITEAEAIKSIIQDDYVNKIGNKRIRTFSMEIKLIDGKPMHSSPRRLSYGEKQEVQKTIDKLIDEGIIQPSNSPYASPIVLVRKNGKLRMCVDYRPVNKMTVRDNFPLPLIEDCLEYFSGKKYFSTLDLKNGFHQVPMHKDSVPITSCDSNGTV